MSHLASILFLAGSIAAANAASSVPIATQPLLSTEIISAASNALSTSLSTFVSTETVVLYTTFTSRQKTLTSSVGQQLSIVTSTSTLVGSGSDAKLSTIVSTIGSTTLYGIEASTEAALPTSTSVIPPAVVPTTPVQTPETTPINIVTSTASLLTYSTSLASTSPALATSAASTNTSPASPKKSSKKISGGAAAGIAIGVALLIGGIAGALIVILGKRRRQKKWGREGTSDSPGGESKTNLFSPDARAGYDSMWKKPVVAVSASEKAIHSGIATTTPERVSPVSHERGDSSTLGMDAPSISPTASGAGTPKTDVFGDKPKSPGPWKTVPNFSTPNRRSESITALPRMGS
jgi:hypothetical protein